MCEGNDGSGGHGGDRVANGEWQSMMVVALEFGGGLVMVVVVGSGSAYDHGGS